MTLPLVYGDPPREEDCVDGGTLQVATTISNDSLSPEAGNIEMREAYGGKKPSWAIARLAVVRARNFGVEPVMFRVQGLGTLYYSSEGWKVE